LTSSNTIAAKVLTLTIQDSSTKKFVQNSTLMSYEYSTQESQDIISNSKS